MRNPTDTSKMQRISVIPSRSLRLNFFLHPIPFLYKTLWNWLIVLKCRWVSRLTSVCLLSSVGSSESTSGSSFPTSKLFFSIWFFSYWSFPPIRVNWYLQKVLPVNFLRFVKLLLPYVVIPSQASVLKQTKLQYGRLLIKSLESWLWNKL